MNGGVNEGKLQLFEFLRGLTHKGRHLLVNPNKLLSLQQMQQALLRGDRYLDEFDDEVRRQPGLVSCSVEVRLLCCLTVHRLPVVCRLAPGQTT
jgi:hypothetical protein